MNLSDLVIEQAATEVRRLLDLLENPEPGLSTWLQAVDNQAHKVAWTFGYGAPHESH